jgi:hypothetical protein
VLGRHGRREAQHRGLRTISAFLRELDGGDRPLSIVAADRNSQAVQFVKRNPLHGPGLSVREDYGLAHKLPLGLLELAEDRGLASATRGPTSLLRARSTNAFGNSCPSLHLRIICMRFTPPPQGELITAVLSPEQIVELVRLRDFL